MNNKHVRRATRVDWLSGAWSHACIKSDGKSEHSMLSFLLSHHCLCISSWNNVLILGNDDGERNPKKSSQRQPAKGHQQEKEYWQNLLTLANSTHDGYEYIIIIEKTFVVFLILNLNFLFSSFYFVHGEDLIMRFVGRHFRWYAKNVCASHREDDEFSWFSSNYRRRCFPINQNAPTVEITLSLKTSIGGSWDAQQASSIHRSLLHIYTIASWWTAR